MINRFWMGGRLLALIATLMLGLTACSSGQAPPPEVITQAVTQQAQQAQQQLWQGLSHQSDTPQLNVSRVKPARTRSILVDGQDAYQIKGNYQLELRYSSRRVKQTAPFEVILQAVPDRGAWRWLSPVGHSPGQSLQWQQQLLSRDRPLESPPS